MWEYKNGGDRILILNLFGYGVVEIEIMLVWFCLCMVDGKISELFNLDSLMEEVIG